jgi:hypothetical protein
MDDNPSKKARLVQVKRQCNSGLAVTQPRAVGERLRL